MAFEITISDETAEHLVVDLLKNSLECVRAEIQRLEGMPDLSDWQQTDLQDSYKIANSLVEVIRYYTPANQHDLI